MIHFCMNADACGVKFLDIFRIKWPIFIWNYFEGNVSQGAMTLKIFK